MMGLIKHSKILKAQDSGNEPETEETVEHVTEAGSEQSESRHASIAGDADLGKVRELLFGSQMRETRIELSRLEEKLSDEATRFRADLDEQLAGMGRLVHERTNAAMEKIHSESTARQIGDEVVIKKLEEVREHLEKKMDAVTERSNRVERELREQLLSQCKLLSDAITQKHEEAVSLVSRGIDEVKASKLDRSSVASLFKELAGRLESSTDH